MRTWTIASIVVWTCLVGPPVVAPQIIVTVGGPISLGRWHASLEVPGGELPFILDLGGSYEAPTATLVNGEGTTPVDLVSIKGDSLQLRLWSFGASIDAVVDNGQLQGTLRLVKRGGVVQEMPFRAIFAEGFVFKREVTPAVDVTGRWDVCFTDDGGVTTNAVGEFHQEGITVNGTFLTPTGDYRFLSGEVDGHNLRLSCFDGGHAYLFTARVVRADSIAGDFWSGTQWHETWTAVRDDRASLPDPDTLTRMRPGAGPLAFTFPDVNGAPVSLSDARFRGKVVVVVILGSWCPNCHDEIALLSRLYDSHRGRGLEIVGLMYEHFRDFDRAAAQVRHLQARYDIAFPLLIAGYSDKAEASATLPMLTGVVAFPTMIAIDRSGEVRRIYTGFSGPGTGARYDRLVADLTSFIDGLLNER